MDQLPRLGKRELICLLSFTCNYVVFVWRGFLFLWVLGMGYVILLWHSLSLPYNYFPDTRYIKKTKNASSIPSLPYYGGSPLHIALPNFRLIFIYRHLKNNNRCIKTQFQCDLPWILKCNQMAANRTFAKRRFAANRTATKLMGPVQKRNHLNWMTTELS